VKERILGAAVAEFASRGYGATSMRDIAALVPCSPANIYNFFPSKEELLLAVLRSTAERLRADVLGALETAGSAPPATRLAAAVAAHVRFHCTRSDESYIAAAEIRSLSPADRAIYVGQRDEYEALFVALVAAGVDDRSFATPHPREATRAILAMATAVATWFRPDQTLTSDDVAAIYADLALAAVQHTPAPAVRRRRSRASATPT
jgi:AcrR family transcriptional regulator